MIQLLHVECNPMFLIYRFLLHYFAIHSYSFNFSRFIFKVFLLIFQDVLPSFISAGINLNFPLRIIK